MKCPYCYTELVNDKPRRLETLGEHVCCATEISEKPSFICPSLACPTRNLVCWDEEGSLYVIGDYKKYHAANIKWIGGNDAPLPSYQRQINVELSKHDEDFLLLTVRGWKCYIRWNYDADELGNIISKRMKVEWVTPEGYVYISGLRMFNFCMRRLIKYRWQLYQGRYVGHSEWAYRQLQRETEAPIGKQWWRIANQQVARWLLKRIKVSA
jgi:hypothetical protein